MADAAPTTPNRTLPRRQPNSAYRQREYLTEKKVEKLIEAARKRGRNGPRDGAAILLAYRHGLRAQELCHLRWVQVDLRNGRLHVNRAKGGAESVPYAVLNSEPYANSKATGPHVFTTEAGTKRYDGAQGRDLHSIKGWVRNLGACTQEATMTDITLASLSLLIALLAMMAAAEVGQRRRSRH
jgi:integrase